jgi:hypothetical protein
MSKQRSICGKLKYSLYYMYNLWLLGGDRQIMQSIMTLLVGCQGP